MAEDQREFQIQTGMDVVDREGNRLGDLDTILSEDQTNLSRFMIVKGKLLPVEAISGVEGDKVKLTIAQDKFEQFPKARGGETPSQEDQKKAYQAINLKGPLTEGGGGGKTGAGPGGNA